MTVQNSEGTVRITAVALNIQEKKNKAREGGMRRQTWSRPFRVQVDT